MPNRIIKESICESEKIASLTDFEFRLWIGMITQADDAGRGDARPAILKGRVFALRERVTVKDIDAAIHALAAKGCVTLYHVDGRPYFLFPGWSKHQRVRDCRPKYPEPDEKCQSAATCGNPPQSAADCGLNPIQSESKTESESESKSKIPLTPFEQAVEDFKAHRKAMKKPMTDRAIELLFKKLDDMAPGDDDRKVAILNQSIERGWLGVFDLKADDYQPTHRHRQPGGKQSLYKNSDFSGFEVDLDAED